MTVVSASFSVAFGKIARTLEYRGARGCLVFTFDVGSDTRTLFLEHHGVREPRPSYYDEAFARSKQFLLARGYKVEEEGLARLPVPLSQNDAAALISAEVVPPIPASLRVLDPPLRASFADDTGGTPWSLWIVAELKTGAHTGHKLVFDEHTRHYGVASPEGAFLGFWGTFRQTLEAICAK